MNNELKRINKAIRYINEVLTLEELFKPIQDQHTATAIFQEKRLEAIAKNHKARLPLTLSPITFVSQFRSVFQENTFQLKRQIKNDVLVSVSILEKETNASFPLSKTKFIEMISKLSFA